jgi:hypothetical protein
MCVSCLRVRVQGKAEKRKALAAEGGGKFGARKRRKMGKDE